MSLFAQSPALTGQHTTDLAETKRRISSGDLTSRLADAVVNSARFHKLYQQTGNAEHYNAYYEWDKERVYLLDIAQRYAAAKARGMS
jgi:hypothetical protein